MSYSPDQRYFFSATEFVNYRIVGKGEKSIVFLHGFGASGRSWDDIIPILKPEGAKFILFDLIGAGFSSRGRNADCTMRANAAVIVSFIREHGIRDLVLAGHSFGGGVALNAAFQLLEDAAHRPAGLVLLDAAAYESELPFFVRYLRFRLVSDVLLKVLPARLQARLTLERLYFDKAKVTPEKVQRYAFFLGMKGYNKALGETARQISPQDWLGSEKLRNITIPVLVLWGRQDPVLPVAQAIRLAKEIPHARLGIVEDCGHNIQEEQPQEVARLVNGFLADLWR